MHGIIGHSRLCQNKQRLRVRLRSRSRAAHERRRRTSFSIHARKSQMASASRRCASRIAGKLGRNSWSPVSTAAVDSADALHQYKDRTVTPLLCWTAGVLARRVQYECLPLQASPATFSLQKPALALCRASQQPLRPPPPPRDAAAWAPFPPPAAASVKAAAMA